MDKVDIFIKRGDIVFANVISTRNIEANLLASCSSGNSPSTGSCYNGYGPAPGYFCKRGAVKVAP